MGRNFDPSGSLAVLLTGIREGGSGALWPTLSSGVLLSVAFGLIQFLSKT